MKKAAITQILIFIIAWALMTPDTIEDNTHIFGLIGSVEVIKGNTIWVMLGAMVLSVLNLWFWWPKKVKVISTSETAKEDTKSAEAEVKEIDRDPKTPDLS